MADEEEPLEEILGEQEPEEKPEPEEPEQEEAQAEPEQEEPEEETGEKEQEAPPAPENVIPIQALLDEREKRQALERELERAKRAQKEAQSETETPPDPFEDPEGFQSSLEAKIAQAALNERFNTSEALARRTLGDEAVDEALEAWKGEIEKRPYLQQQLVSEADPYGFVVDYVKRQSQLSEIGDADALREKIRKEVEAEFEAKKKDETRSSIPETLAGESNQGTRKAPPFSEPDLEDLVTNIEDQPST